MCNKVKFAPFCDLVMDVFFCKTSESVCLEQQLHKIVKIQIARQIAAPCELQYVWIA